MEIKDQEIVANDVLSKLSLLDENCILAGGAPRDWYLNLSARDLDIYFYHKNAENIFYDIEQIFGEILYIKPFNGGYEYSNPFIQSIYSMKYKGCEVQFILMKQPITPEFVLNTFLLDICRIWYKSWTLYPSQVFKESVKHEVIRCVGPYYNPVYIAKIRDRFPDYLFIG